MVPDEADGRLVTLRPSHVGTEEGRSLALLVPDDEMARRREDVLAKGLPWLVAERDGGLVGLTHYLLHRSTWAPVCYCYLEDLFVEPSLRGGGTGRKLISAVETAARAAGASRLYWMTHETNETAQQLYNKVADRPGFVQYRKKL